MAARRGKTGSGKRGRRTAGSAARPKAAAKSPARSQAKSAAKPRAKARSTSKATPSAKPRSAPKPGPNSNSKARTAARTRPAPPRKSYAGGCHCGALEFTYETALRPRRWAVLNCQCGFCRGHGARMTADPAGLVHFDWKLPEFLRRYRFGLRTGDYLVCRECGTYVAAVLLTGRGALATINVNTLREPPKAIPPGKPVEPELETMEARRAYRARTWTPVTGPV